MKNSVDIFVWFYIILVFCVALLCVFTLLSSMLWCPLWFPHKNDVRFIFTSSCLFVRGLMSCLHYLCLFVRGLMSCLRYLCLFVRGFMSCLCYLCLFVRGLMSCLRYLCLFVRGFMSCLHYLCLFAYSGVQHTLCCVFRCQFLWYSLTFIYIHIIWWICT
jgi:hypothetical protein